MINPLSEALAEHGYDVLTPVQEAVTAPELEDADLLVSAQTGSGKTVAFGLAIAPTLLKGADTFGRAGAPQAIMVAPTRELAFQVMNELKWLYKRTGAVVTSCVGGMDARQERRALERGAHIVVGTPGRLCDHIRRGALDLSGIEAAVLDEADEMLDLGFKEDLEYILDAAPTERRTLLFSATVSPQIANIAKQYQRNAQRISTIDKAKQHTDIAYKAMRVSASDGDHAIFNLLRFHDKESALVFANTRANVAHLSARLTNRGLSVVTLSGELSQSERSHALQAMRDGRARVCVATDVAARGIDLPNLNLVIHADLPTNTEALLHRSGRTGRAGRKGISALIVPPKMVKRAERLLKWAKITAEWELPPSADDIIAQDEIRLLENEAFANPVAEDEADFVGKLLEKHTPEAIAAALLRLHKSSYAAPEELSAPETRPERNHKEFGPSRWFSLSIGRKDRAEARWLLPMLCRTANIDKNAIGAIRVQETETYIEIAQAQIKTFDDAAQSNSELDDGVRVTALAQPPEDTRPPRHRKGGGEGGGKSRFGGKKPYGNKGGSDDRGRFDKPRSDKPRGDKPWADKPRGEKPSGDKPRGDKPWSDKPRGDKPHGDKPRKEKVWSDKPRGEKSFGDKPRHKKSGDSFSDKPKGPRKGGKTDYSNPSARVNAKRGPSAGKGGSAAPKRGKS